MKFLSLCRFLTAECFGSLARRGGGGVGAGSGLVPGRFRKVQAGAVEVPARFRAGSARFRQGEGSARLREGSGQGSGKVPESSWAAAVEVPARLRAGSGKVRDSQRMNHESRSVLNHES